MFTEQIIQGIRILRPTKRDGLYYLIENTVTGACFFLIRKAQNEGEFTIWYRDSFGNVMLNNKDLKIIYNKDKIIQFQGYPSQVYFSHQTSVTALSMKDIQEIANKTFYLDEQKQVVDFERLIIIEPHRSESLLKIFM